MKKELAISLLAVLAAMAGPAAAQQQCTLEYQRADNMFAAPGRPDGFLGTETLTLQAGEKRVFNTDWKYEKQRNDGANYYGSHLRIARNTGKRPMHLVLRGDLSALRGAIGAAVLAQEGSDRARGILNPGATWTLRNDLMEVSCPSADKEAKMQPPTGLEARQVSPREIVLTWQRVPDAKEYRVYVDPPPAPHLAGKPGLLSASGSRYVIMLPPAVAPGTVYRASIEAISTGGVTSQRVEFPSVMVQLAAGPGGGSPQPGGGAGTPPAGGPAASPGTPGGQRCPQGEFVTGFDGAGRILCARP